MTYDTGGIEDEQHQVGVSQPRERFLFGDRRGDPPVSAPERRRGHRVREAEGWFPHVESVLRQVRQVPGPAEAAGEGGVHHGDPPPTSPRSFSSTTTTASTSPSHRTTVGRPPWPEGARSREFQAMGTWRSRSSRGAVLLPGTFWRWRLAGERCGRMINFILGMRKLGRWRLEYISFIDFGWFFTDDAGDNSTLPASSSLLPPLSSLSSHPRERIPPSSQHG